MGIVVENAKEMEAESLIFDSKDYTSQRAPCFHRGFPPSPRVEREPPNLLCFIRYLYKQLDWTEKASCCILSALQNE